MRVCRKHVHALMRAHGLARDREPGETPRGRVVVPEPNRRIATDLTTVWTRRDGNVALVPTIDCGDRTTVVAVTKDQHGAAFVASVELKLVAAFGTPENAPIGVELPTTTGHSTPAPTAATDATARASSTRTPPLAARPPTP